MFPCNGAKSALNQCMLHLFVYLFVCVVVFLAQAGTSSAHENNVRFHTIEQVQSATSATVGSSKNAPCSHAAGCCSAICPPCGISISSQDEEPLMFVMDLDLFASSERVSLKDISIGRDPPIPRSGLDMTRS